MATDGSYVRQKCPTEMSDRTGDALDRVTTFSTFNGATTISNIHMKTRLGVTLLLCVSLAACGGGGGGGDRDLPGDSASPAPAPSSLTIGGIAAVGAALDGATVSVSGPDGVLLDAETILTGRDGRYSLDLDAGQAFPLLIEVLTPEGDILRAIVDAPEDPAGTITAHVNPITDLVTRRLTEQSTSLEAALGAVAEAADLLRQAGDDAVQSLLGPEAQYAAFAADPGFTAADGSGGVPSVTDTVLDTLGVLAGREGLALTDFLAARVALPEPEPLMSDPGFQVRLVAQLIEQGNAGTDIVNRLAESSLVTPIAQGGSQPVLETMAARLPGLLDELGADLEALGTDRRTADLTAQALVEALARYAESRTADFESDPAETAAALADEALGAQFVDTMVATLVPLAGSLAAEGAGDLLTGDAMAAVADRIGAAAGEVFAAISPEQILSNDFSLLAGTIVSDRLGNLDGDVLAALESGTASLDEVVPEPADLGVVQEQIRATLEQSPELVAGSTEVVLDVLPNAWDQADWDLLTWR